MLDQSDPGLFFLNGIYSVSKNMSTNYLSTCMLSLNCHIFDLLFLYARLFTVVFKV